MAEIRLICPGCEAEYRVPDSAIPAEGREVECSACGNVWHAGGGSGRPAPGEALPTPPADLPRLNRRLPDSVLDILRDEVEHERRARAAEDGALPPSAAAPRLIADPEWPATTITRHPDPKAASAPPAMPPSPAPLKPAPAQQTRPAIAPPPEPAQETPEPPPEAAAPAAAPRPRGGGYAAGFGLAAMLTAACLALYLLAPSLADQGGWGEELMQVRARIDEARLWLQDRAPTVGR